MIIPISMLFFPFYIFSFPSTFFFIVSISILISIPFWSFWSFPFSFWLFPLIFHHFQFDRSNFHFDYSHFHFDHSHPIPIWLSHLLSDQSHFECIPECIFNSHFFPFPFQFCFISYCSSFHQFINSSIHQFINSPIHQFINLWIH